MNTNFGDVTDRLNAEHERIVAAQAPSHGFQKADMKPEILIVSCKLHIPAAINAHTFATKDRSEHACFHDAHAGPPDIEVTVAPSFNQKKHQGHQSDQNKRKR